MWCTWAREKTHFVWSHIFFIFINKWYYFYPKELWSTLLQYNSLTVIPTKNLQNGPRLQISWSFLSGMEQKNLYHLRLYKHSTTYLIPKQGYQKKTLTGIRTADKFHMVYLKLCLCKKGKCSKQYPIKKRRAFYFDMILWWPATHFFRKNK